MRKEKKYINADDLVEWLIEWRRRVKEISYSSAQMATVANITKFIDHVKATQIAEGSEVDHE